MDQKYYRERMNDMINEFRILIQEFPNKGHYVIEKRKVVKVLQMLDKTPLIKILDFISNNIDVAKKINVQEKRDAKLYVWTKVLDTIMKYIPK